MFIAIIIVAILIFCYYLYTRRTSNICIDVGCWHVVAEYDNRADAARLMAEAHRRLMKFMTWIQRKYYIGVDDKTFADLVSRGKIPADYKQSDIYNIMRAILVDYDPTTLRENDPRWTGDTSYNINKGERIYLCLRSKTEPGKLVDINTLMFVLLHEVGGHIGNYNGWGHPTRFWSIFKLILLEASAAGAYIIENYDKNPVVYCGLRIDYQPALDTTLPQI